jgi:hypothetical protein
MLSGQTLRDVQVLSPEELRDRHKDFDIALPLSEKFSYAPTYLEDLVNAFKYADVDFVTKSLTDAGHAMPEHESFDSLPEPSAGGIWLDSEAGRAYLAGTSIEGAGYVADPLGIDLKKESVALVSQDGPAPEPLLSVIVPVHNNGEFLLHKCVRSLERSSLFD